MNTRKKDKIAICEKMFVKQQMSSYKEKKENNKKVDHAIFLYVVLCLDFLIDSSKKRKFSKVTKKEKKRPEVLKL